MKPLLHGSAQSLISVAPTLLVRQLKFVTMVSRKAKFQKLRLHGLLWTPWTKTKQRFAMGYGSRYEHNGLIIVQLLIDRQAVDVAETARKVAVVARNIFRGQTFDGCIIFRNVRINRLDPENRFWRYNVIAEYQFDEIA
jgi:hypothetical protein